MARKPSNLSEKTKKEEAERKLQYKIASIKSDFESGRIKSFEHIFALIGPSIWAKMLHMGYTTFLNKSKNPGDFTNNELILFAETIDVDINIIAKFIFATMRFKNKHVKGEPIRL